MNGITQSEQLIKTVNEYVKKYGTDTVMSKMEILKMAGLENKAGHIFPSDYSYNWYNNGLKNFEERRLFERISSMEYRLLGENYPYTGVVNHKPKGEVSEKAVARWEEDKLSWY